MKPSLKEGAQGEQVSSAKHPQGVSPDEKLLQEVAQVAEPRVAVIGVGGAGCNTITRLNAIGMGKAETVAVNTDVQHLLETVSGRKVLLGKELCGGYGAGADYKIGEEATKESADEVRELIEGADVLFLTAGLGGGTGTGGAPIVAEVAKDSGALVVGIITLPFEAEGERKMSVAMWGLERLSKHIDTLIVIRNDRILEITGDLPMHQAFLVADEIMARAIKALVEVALKPGLINVDMADIRTVLEDGGLALMGVGQSDLDNRAMKALQEALENPLFEGDTAGATGAIVHISCGTDFSLDEMGEVIETVAGTLDPEANLIWGVGVDGSLKGTVKVLVVIVGVRSAIYEGRIKGREIKPLIPEELALAKVPRTERPENVDDITERLDIERI